MPLLRKQRVSMDIGDMRGVTPVGHECTVRGISFAVLLPHLPVLAGQGRLTCAVNHHHLSHYFAETDTLVVVNGVAGHDASVHMMNDRAVQ